MMNRLSVIANLRVVQGLLVIVALNGCTTLNSSKTVPPVTTPAVTDTTTYHTVAPGETLAEIAYRYGYSDVAEVAAWNGIAPPYNIMPGQRLLVSRPTGYAYTPPVDTATTYPVTPAPATPAKPITRPKKPATPSKLAGKGEIYHTVQRGENLYRISKNYGYRTEQVAAWNNIAPPYTLEVGQRLRIVGGKGTSAPAPYFEESYYTVQVGDSLDTIAQQHGYNAKDVAAWNNLQPPYNLTVGQLIRVNPPSGKSAAPTNKAGGAAASTSKADYHTVTAQDTLYSIAKTYGQSLADIAVWNNLQPPYSLQVGKQLRVSGTAAKGSVPASGSSARSRAKNATAGIQRHVVKAGETLKSIAEKYGLTSFDLAIWNGIGSPYTVYPGQNLQIVKP